MTDPNTLFVFNPEHDLALANGNAHYLPPRSATQFADDVAALPAWIFGFGNVRVPSTADRKSLYSLFEIFDIQSQLVVSEDIPPLSVYHVLPWGWDHAIRQKLLNEGVQESVLPDDAFLQNVRRLSHRAFAADAGAFLKAKSEFADLFPKTAVFLSNMSDIEQFLADYQDVIFKLPWSGSGKGLKRGMGVLTDNLRGWVLNSIAKYGGVMCEPRWKVVQDFAMEFECFENVNFCGYSLFNTQNGAYQGNILMPDENIRHSLRQWIPLKALDEVQSLLIQFLKENILPFYHGFLGIDMFVYEQNGAFFLNPVVEINLRLTMGLLANRFVKKYLLPNKIGTLRVQYSPSNGKLLAEHNEWLKRFPLVIENKRMVSGYLSLCPINSQTHYAVQINVQDDGLTTDSII